MGGGGEKRKEKRETNQGKKETNRFCEKIMLTPLSLFPPFSLLPLNSGKIPTTLDEEGRYFIDRNGKIFEPLLDFLRTNILDIPHGISRQHVLEQAHFFGIKIDGICFDFIYIFLFCLLLTTFSFF